MKYLGMPMGMWALFAGSFQKQLTAVFGYDSDTAEGIAKTQNQNTKQLSQTCRNLKKRIVSR